MKLHHVHPWDLDPAAAIAPATKTAYPSDSDRPDRSGAPEWRGGCRIRGGRCRDPGGGGGAALSRNGYWKPWLPAGRPLFPYIPGLLSFRELPAVLAALERLREPPDLLLCDGRASPIRVAWGSPAISACWWIFPRWAWPRLGWYGNHGDVPDQRGHGRRCGWMTRSSGRCCAPSRRVKPLYVSSGHRIGLETAIAYVMGCCTRYRLPETTRHAHRLASAGGCRRVHSVSRRWASEEIRLRREFRWSGTGPAAW